VGLDRADVFRLLRGQPTGPVQRDRRESFGWQGQGGLLRRHPHSHDHAVDRRASPRRLAGPAGRLPMVGHPDHRALRPTPVILAVRPIRNLDGQQNITHSQNIGTGSLIVFLLAERAPSEGPRSTRAIEDQSDRPLESATSKLGRTIYMTFLPRSASADTSLLRSCSRNPKASLWRSVISLRERGILLRNVFPSGSDLWPRLKT